MELSRNIFYGPMQNAIRIPFEDKLWHFWHFIVSKLTGYVVATDCIFAINPNPNPIPINPNPIPISINPNPVSIPIPIP